MIVEDLTTKFNDITLQRYRIILSQKEENLLVSKFYEIRKDPLSNLLVKIAPEEIRSVQGDIKIICKDNCFLISSIEDLDSLKLVKSMVSIIKQIEALNGKYINIKLYGIDGQLYVSYDVSQFPTNYFSLILKNSISFFKNNKKSLAEEYIRVEKALNERFVYDGKILKLVANFAPFSDYDLFGVINSFGILKMAKYNFNIFVEELYKIIKEYHSLTKHNFIVYVIDSSRIKDPGIVPIIRILSLKSFIYESLPSLEPISNTIPEDFARLIRKKLS